MDIFDSEGEFDEVFLVMLITDDKINKTPFQVLGKLYEEYPFKNIGKIIIDNGLFEGKVVKKTTRVCVIKYYELYYKITYKSLSKNDEYGCRKIIYTITPSNEFKK